MRRPAGHPRSSIARALLGALACAWMTHTGCVSLDFPPERVDSGAGGSYADVSSSSGGNLGGDAIERDAAIAPDVPAVGPGTGGIDFTGSGGDIPAGAGGLAIGTGGTGATLGGTGGAIGDGTGGAIGDGTGGAGGASLDGASPEIWDAGLAEAAGSGGSNGGTGGTAADALTDAVDAPASDGSPDVPVTSLTTGLVVYFPCESADGSNLQDKSGGGNNGQIVAASSSGYRFEAGKVGNGLTLLPSQGAYVSLGPHVFKGMQTLTIALWLKLASVTSWQRLFDIGVNANLSQNAPTGTAYFSLVLKDFNSKLGLTSSKDGYNNSNILTTDVLPTGVWKHVAIVAGNGGATIYVDGNGVASVPSLLPPGALGNVDYAFIGKSQFTGDPSIDAEIDSFRVYNRALSADEIRALVDLSGP